MVVQSEAERKKEERKAYDRRYREKKRAAKAKVGKEDRNVRARRYRLEEKARRARSSVENNLKTTGESDELSGVAAGGNDLERRNAIDAFNIAGVEFVGVAARVTEHHLTDSALDSALVNENARANSRFQCVRMGAVQRMGAVVQYGVNEARNMRRGAVEVGAVRDGVNEARNMRRGALEVGAVQDGVNEAQNMRRGAVEDGGFSPHSCEHIGDDAAVLLSYRGGCTATPYVGSESFDDSAGLVSSQSCLFMSDAGKCQCQRSSPANRFGDTAVGLCGNCESRASGGCSVCTKGWVVDNCFGVNVDGVVDYSEIAGKCQNGDGGRDVASASSAEGYLLDSDGFSKSSGEEDGGDIQVVVDKIERLLNDAGKADGFEGKEVIVADLIGCRYPIDDRLVRMFLREVCRRFHRCIKRAQLSNACRLAESGLACYYCASSHWHLSSEEGDRVWLGIEAAAKKLCWEYVGVCVVVDGDHSNVGLVLSDIYNVFCLGVAFFDDAFVRSLYDYASHRCHHDLDSFDCVVGRCEYGRLGHVIMNAAHAGNPNVVSIGQEVPVVDSEEAKEFWCGMLGDSKEGTCANCHRGRSGDCRVNDVYYFDLYKVWRCNVKREDSGLRVVQSTKNRNLCDSDILCTECVMFLVRIPSLRKSAVWQYAWPSFYWNLLTGYDRTNRARFTSYYEPQYLYRFIPLTLRRYWDKSLEDVDGYETVKDWSDVRPHCIDRTSDVSYFWSNIKEYTYTGMLKVLDPDRLAEEDKVDDAELRNMAVPDTLCPWGCYEFCFASSVMEPSRLIQFLLPMVQLNLLPSSFDTMYLVESCRVDYIRRTENGETVDLVLLNDEWEILPSVRFVSGAGLMVCVCRYHAKHDKQKRLYCHVPRKPSWLSDSSALCLHNLSGFKSDELAPAVFQQRIAKPVTRKGINTTSTSYWHRNCYTGADSANIQFGGRFEPRGAQTTSFYHQVLSHNRFDIRESVAPAFVREGVVAAEVADYWRDTWQEWFDNDELIRWTRGATFTPVWNALELQKDAMDGGKINVLVQRKKMVGRRVEVYEEVMFLNRTWSKLLYNAQIEDPDRYGCRLKAIPALKNIPSKSRGRRAVMMTYVILGLVSGCKELHFLIGEKEGIHSYNNFSGFMLTFVHRELMKHCDVIKDKMSPFNKITTTKLCEIVFDSFPRACFDESEPFSINYHQNLFALSAKHMKALFPRSQYPSLMVVDRHPINFDLNETKVVIVVSTARPDGSAWCRSADSGDVYEARVVVVLSRLERFKKRFATKKKIKCAIKNDENAGHFDAVRYVRHGGYYFNWWRQTRDGRVMVHVPGVSNAEDDRFPVLELGCFMYVTVYVKKRSAVVESYSLEMHRSIGGQCSFFCRCDGSLRGCPLMTTSMRKEERRSCMMCNKSNREKYICLRCGFRVCNGCFRRSTANGCFTVDGVDDRWDEKYSGAEKGSAESDGEDSDGGLTVGSNKSMYDCSDNEVASVGDELGMQLEEDALFDDADQVAIDDGDAVVGGNASIDGSVERNEEEYPQSDSDDEPDIPKLKKIKDSGHVLNSDPLLGNEYPVIDKMIVSSQDDSCLEDVAKPSDENIVGLSSALSVPRVDGSVREITVLDRNESERPCAPMHVMFNQALGLMTRHKQPILGSMYQRHIVERLVSTLYGVSMPILYPQGMLFPKHFYASSASDGHAILGCPPISCYRGNLTHPDGFASNLERARNLITHASSSTSTDHALVAFHYDTQVNTAGSNYDSRSIQRFGMTSDARTASGFALADHDESNLSESVDSRRAVMNLAAAAVEHEYDAFLTYTLGESAQPGISTIYKWYNGKNWCGKIPGYYNLPFTEKEDVNVSMSMAYTNLISRVWLEMQDLWIDFIMNSTSTMLKRVIHGFFRREYQNDIGNPCHIHALIALSREDMNNEEFMEFVMSLQRNCVGDIIPGCELIDYMDKGLIRDFADWKEMKSSAFQVLSHTCSTKRCLVRNSDGSQGYHCKKKNCVKDSRCPTENEFVPFPITFPPETLEILERAGVWIPPCNEYPDGKFTLKMFEPRRHIGVVNPSAVENMSPVIPEHFVFSRSMQNMQVVCGTNGVARYLVKYVIDLDKGFKAVVYGDKRGNDYVTIRHDYEHNTKISSNAILEGVADKVADGGKLARVDSRVERERKLPSGIIVGVPQMLHHIWGYPDCKCTDDFIFINTRDFAHRGMAKVSLNKEGSLNKQKRLEGSPGVINDLTLSCLVRMRKLPTARHFTPNQRLLLQSSEEKHITSDTIMLFGVRPAEIDELVTKVGMYNKWFVAEKRIMSYIDIEDGIDVDESRCLWIDGMGRRIRLRRLALHEFGEHLHSLNEAALLPHSRRLRTVLIRMINTSDEVLLDRFVDTDDASDRLPVIVYPRADPEQNMHFILHVLLALGEYTTELDLKRCASIKEAFVLARLISQDCLVSEDVLNREIDRLVGVIIRDVMRYQPIPLKRIILFVNRVALLLRSVLVHGSIPMTEFPSCMSTELHDIQEAELKQHWVKFIHNQLRSMLLGLGHLHTLPSVDEFASATKTNPLRWNPMQFIIPLDQQSNESVIEQRFALKLGTDTVDRYVSSFGNKHYIRGVLYCGSPGAGKTFLLQCVGLYAISMGLKVLTTSFMAYRSSQLGCINIHQLFKLPRKQMVNLYVISQTALRELRRRSNIHLLHLLMTVDMLLIDECGQLSSQQIVVLDIILRELRKSRLPFGGILLGGSFDHKQLGSIGGLPFLLSSHMLSDFTLVKLARSVRAASDPILQRIQQITRMDASDLVGNRDNVKEEFFHLMLNNITFKRSMDEVPPDTWRLYHRKTSAMQAMDEFTRDTGNYLAARGIVFERSIARDYMKKSGSKAEKQFTRNSTVTKLLDQKVKECKELLFFEGAVFEATQNDPHRNYFNSQSMIMLDVPDRETIENGLPITLYAAPCGSPRPEASYHANPPSRDEVVNEWGWKEVKVGVAPERFVSRHNILAYRQQYCLVHPGVSTVNKSMGNTIRGNLAIEVTKDFYPWESGQVVVELSRSEMCGHITIVRGDMRDEDAIERLWLTLCTTTQWTLMTDDIVKKLAVTSPDLALDGGDMNARSINIVEHFPWRVVDFDLPTSCTGYVYMLMSSADADVIYVGQTGRNLPIRLKEHNTGVGAVATAPFALRPWSVVAFITNLGHEDRSGRQRLESRWHGLNESSQRSGRFSVQAAIDNGQEVVKGYNDDQSDCNLKLNFVQVMELA